MSTPMCPVLYRVAPGAPKLRCTRGDLEPVGANEDEVVRALRRPAKVSIWNDVPTENFPEYLWREESRYVQQRVALAFESDYGPLMFFNLPFQRSYGIEVDFSVHCYSRSCVRGGGMPRGSAYSHPQRCRLTTCSGLNLVRPSRCPISFVHVCLIVIGTSRSLARRHPS